MEVDSAGLRVLTRDESLALLATAQIGRIAVSSRAMPLILPVHFALDRDRIVISTQDGSTLHAATRDVVVAFEADGLVADSDRRWSVHVNGIASHLGDRADVDQTAILRLPAWSTRRPTRLVSLSTERIDGRLVIDEDQLRTLDGARSRA